MNVNERLVSIGAGRDYRVEQVILRYLQISDVPRFEIRTRQ